MMIEVVFSLLATFAVFAPGAPENQSTKPGPALPASAATRAGWLVGCWRSTDNRGPNLRETWTRATADMLVGTSTRLAAPFVPEYTFYRIESAPDGALSLVSQNAGDRPERLLADGAPVAGEVRFKNTEPAPLRRVEYRRGKKDDELLIRFEAEATKALEVPMKKSGCR